MIKKVFFILTILILIAMSLSFVSANDNVTANLEDLAFEINSTDVGHTLNLNHDYKSTNSSN